MRRGGQGDDRIAAIPRSRKRDWRAIWGSVRMAAKEMRVAWRLVFLLICLWLPLTAAAEDRPRAGIMWNRSGLPATFPLQVRTLPGKDYVVFLVEPASGSEVMAGYIRGGQFFRLLVPPGRWLVRFAGGREWQGEAELFGAGTDWTETDEPLEFRILGTSRRSGYLITLIEQNGSMKIVDAMAQDWCQIALWSREWRDFPPEPDARDDDIPDVFGRVFPDASALAIPEPRAHAMPQIERSPPAVLSYRDRELQTFARPCA